MVRLPPVLPHQALDFDAALFRARAAERLVFLPDIVTFDCCDSVGGGRDRSLVVRISSDAAGVVPMRSMSQGSGSGRTCSVIEQRSTGEYCGVCKKEPPHLNAKQVFDLGLMFC